MIELNLIPENENDFRNSSIGNALRYIFLKNRNFWNRRELKENPENSEAHRIRGCELDEKGRKDLAEVHFKTAVDLDPDNWMAWQNLASLCSDPHEKLEYLAKATQISPSNVGQNLWNFAKNLAHSYNMNDPKEAAYLYVLDTIETQRKFSKIDKDTKTLLAEIKWLESMHKEYLAFCKNFDKKNKAVAFYKAAMKHNPEDFRKFFITAMKMAGLSEDDAKKEADSYSKPDLIKKIERIQAKARNLESLTETEDVEVIDFEEYSGFLLENARFIGVDEAQSKFESLVSACGASPKIKYDFGLMILRNTNVYETVIDNLSPNREKIKKSNTPNLFARKMMARAFEINPDFNPDWEPFYSQVIEHYAIEGDLGRQLIVFGKKDRSRDDQTDRKFQIKKLNEIDYSDFNMALMELGKITGVDEKARSIAAIWAIVKGDKEEEIIADYPISSRSFVSSERPGIEKYDKNVDSVLKSALEGRRQSEILGDYPSCRENIERIAAAKKSGDNAALADELSKIGLYDDAIKTAEIAEESGQKYIALGHSHESKWIRDGKEEDLEKAYEAYFKAAEILGPEYEYAVIQINHPNGEPRKIAKYASDYPRICVHLAEIGFLIEKDEFETLAEMVREPGKNSELILYYESKPKFYTDESQIIENFIKIKGMREREEKRLEKERAFAEPSLAAKIQQEKNLARDEVKKAYMHSDFTRKIDALEGIEQEHPDLAKATIGEACAEYAPQLTSKLKKLCGVE